MMRHQIQALFKWLGFFHDLNQLLRTLVKLSKKRIRSFIFYDFQERVGQVLCLQAGEGEFMPEYHTNSNTENGAVSERDFADLKQAVDLFKTMLHCSPVGMYIVQGRKFRYVNPQFERITGYTKEELLGRDCSMVVLPEDRDKVRKHAVDMLKGLRSAPYEFRGLTKDGQIRWVLEQVTSIQYRGGRATLGNYMDIADRKKAEEALKASEAELRQIAENTHDIIARVNKQGVLEYVSPSSIKITGFTPEESMGRSIFELVHPEDMREVLAAYETALQALLPGRAEFRYRHKNGRYIWFEATGNILFDENREAAGAILVARDITERKNAEVKLREANRQLLNVIEFLPDATLVIDREGKVIAWNRAIEEMTGVKKEDMLGQGEYAYAVPFYGVRRTMLIDLVFMDDEEVREKYEYVERERDAVYAEVRIPSLRGREVYLWGKASPLYDGEGNVVGAIESIRDTTERMHEKERLKYLSLHDPLTGLYNRAYFEEELRRVEDGRSDPVSVIVIDIDGLKFINDTLGHDTGDSLLVATAMVIRNSLRETDVVARIGGDEFAALLPRGEESSAQHVCKKIKKKVANYNALNPQVPLSISMGFATRGDASQSIFDLFKEADNKMYREKLHRSQSARSATVQALKKALVERDFITGGHADRLQELVTVLARVLGLPESRISDLRLLA